jgi:hypothetical protein
MSLLISSNQAQKSYDEPCNLGPLIFRDIELLARVALEGNKVDFILETTSQTSLLQPGPYEEISPQLI